MPTVPTRGFATSERILIRPTTHQHVVVAVPAALQPSAQIDPFGTLRPRITKPATAAPNEPSACAKRRLFAPHTSKCDYALRSPEHQGTEAHQPQPTPRTSPLSPTGTAISRSVWLGPCGTPCPAYVYAGGVRTSC